jgi:hypothetical protein
LPREPNAIVRIHDASDGNAVADWSKTDNVVPYGSIPTTEPWTLVPRPEREVIEALAARCNRLDQVADVVVGIQTSADDIYHLTRVGADSYTNRAGKDVSIEDGLMLPVVSGKDVSPWCKPNSTTRVLFPYRPDEMSRMRLINPDTLKADFPKGFAYLQKHEKVLRGRDSRRIDDDERWWGYVYPKNLDKQESPKLLVPRLLITLGCAADPLGSFALDNVDVGGVLPRNVGDLWFLAAVLNGRVANWVWRRLSSHFRTITGPQTSSSSHPCRYRVPMPPSSAPWHTALGSRALYIRGRSGRWRCCAAV